MDAVFRAAAIYFFLLVIFRIAGARTLAQMTTFDFVLLLIVAEATQQGLIGDDFSLTQAIAGDCDSHRYRYRTVAPQRKLPLLDKWIEGTPLVIVHDGKPLEERMKAGASG